MQSQQKRVKWSRGETAEALEERTDTGITQASVELMVNCMPDIFGNVSRRPALKLMTGFPQFEYDKYLQVFPFYITEKEYILIGVHYDRPTELIYVKDGIGIHVGTATTGTAYPKTKSAISALDYGYRPVTYAQQNNYMVIADGYDVYKLQFDIQYSPSLSVTPTMEVWKFSAGWYAPNGTKTKSVTQIAATGYATQPLAFNGHLSPWTFMDNNVGVATEYMAVWTGIGGHMYLEPLEQEIPVGSIVSLPSIGCHMRVEGYFDHLEPFSDTTFNGVLNSWDATPATGTYCKIPDETGRDIQKIVNGAIVGTYHIPFDIGLTAIWAKNSGVAQGYSLVGFYGADSTHFGTWANGTGYGAIWMYGSLLTPVADENAVDNIVTVEYGYESLQPEQWAADANYPHPQKLLFLDQRLWAAGWQNDAIYTQAYSLVIGSQIARYNDLKNDYNQENEPITLDILTAFKEHIVHLIDYNGLKIMTDSYEYAYENGGVVKQSGNGSLEQCEPLVFESLCLYCDSTGNQIKAMQYEFQSNIFNSSGINTIAPKDLIWYPIAMAAFEDKVYSTGKHLFVVNQDSTDHPRLAVCNFVPGNQANIWSRWAFPSITMPSESSTPIDFLHSVVRLKTEPMFLVVFPLESSGLNRCVIMPAFLDFNGNIDAEAPLYSLGTTNYYAPYHTEQPYVRTVMPNTEVAIYADGEFKFLTTTNSTGAITADLTGLTNVTVGLPINATIRSHPIDVGGKTKSVMKRIGKTQISVHDTQAGAITINGKTGYMNPRTDHICFYGVTGMKDEIKYTITNNNGAMFHLESLLMNIEYGTLDS